MPAATTTDWTDWFVEPGDPSVGIFGDLVAHVPCQPEAEEPVEAVEDGVTFARSATQGVLDVFTYYRCPVCGATVADRSQEPAENEDD